MTTLITIAIFSLIFIAGFIAGCIYACNYNKKHDELPIAFSITDVGIPYTIKERS